MSTILAVLETGHKLSLETLGAARHLGAELGLQVHGVECTGIYTADAFAEALAGLIGERKISLVLLPHTYQVRDFAPKLATRFDRALVSDVVNLRVENGTLICVRQLFQGKWNVDVKPVGEPAFVSLQAGAFAAAADCDGVESLAVDSTSARQKPEAAFREAQRAVDLSAADVIVSVGRGIEKQENLALIESLAAALKAEIAASRPICDNGWLPMERQVGSSGQTVAPKLYLAVGLSGAIQHLVGMKGAKCVIAINKDPQAPIFDVANYGVCADLFDILPALTEAIWKERA